jgi:lambda repressor-like predicted transcriptional regulator
VAHRGTAVGAVPGRFQACHVVTPVRMCPDSAVPTMMDHRQVCMASMLRTHGRSMRWLAAPDGLALRPIASVVASPAAVGATCSTAWGARCAIKLHTALSNCIHCRIWCKRYIDSA